LLKFRIFTFGLQGSSMAGRADANAHLTGAIRHLHALDRLPDLVILSGDLVEHGAPEEYAQAASRLKDLTLPFLIVAGNHDDRDCLRQAFPDHRYLPETGALNY
jgi:3',5'-cyclic AMP phosphodiesterase CpdA